METRKPLGRCEAPECERTAYRGFRAGSWDREHQVFRAEDPRIWRACDAHARGFAESPDWQEAR